MDTELTQRVIRWRKAIFEIRNDNDFNDLALEIFHYQYQNNPVYQAFNKGLHTNIGSINHFRDIPFLPAGFFRDHTVVSGEYRGYDRVFASSGTTGSIPARHFVVDEDLYIDSFTRGFDLFYGPPGNFDIFALMPGYSERPESSLVFMVDYLIRMSSGNRPGFYLHDLNKLAQDLNNAYDEKKKVILFGVSYALLDFAEVFGRKIPGVIVMETGGMKGRRKEMIRGELHQVLSQSFGVRHIHSEYGMTELFSQAYSSGGGIFRSPPWMRVLIRDVNDPLSLVGHSTTGGVNVIDLANMLTCSFIGTQDLGISHPDGSFEILGRFDDSEIRGCNLMVS